MKKHTITLPAFGASHRKTENAPPPTGAAITSESAAEEVQPQAQVEAPCKTCKHFTQGNKPLVGKFEMQCFECCNYYASKWAAAPEAP